jgi:hypothetical protein
MPDECANTLRQEAVPVVLVGAPDVDDGAGAVVQGDAVHALLGPARQPVHADDAPIGPEHLPDHAGQLFRVGESAFRLHDCPSQVGDWSSSHSGRSSAIGYSEAQCSTRRE